MKLTHLQIIVLALPCLFVDKSQSMPNPGTTTIEKAINRTKTAIKGAANATNQLITTKKIVCPPNTEYSCNKSCLRRCEDLRNPDYVCDNTCRCTCKDGYVFKSASSDVCVRLAECKCRLYEHFDACAPKQPTCDNPNPPSTGCRPMCVCDRDFIFSAFRPRVCIPKEACFNLRG